MPAIDRSCSPKRRLAGVLLGVLAAAAVSFAQGPASTRLTVAEVILHGNRQVPAQRIMGYIKTRPGQEYSQQTLNDDVRRLYETKQFANIQVDLKYTADGRVNVYFLFVEHPNVIQEIIYQGAKHMKPDDLNQLTGLRKGAPLNPIANRMAAQAIQRKYHEEGRPFASVELVEGGEPGDTRVVFNITEGPVARVGGIAFTGNTFVSDARLATQIQSSRAFLGFLGGKYNRALAELDVAKLEEYYRSYGFRDVRVSCEPQWSEDQRYVTLVFHIHEGERYRVLGTQVSGIKAFPPEEIERLTVIRPGEFYDEAKVTAGRNRIQDYYGYTGRNPVIKEELFSPEPGVCLVHYEIQERPPARVGQIFIVGNEVTRQNVILRQVPLFPGQILTYPDLRVAERNLARLNIFEVNPETGVRPTVTVINPEEDSEFKDILVTVQETRTGAFLLGVGVNSDAGLTGSIVLNERNFDILRPPTSFEDFLSGRAFRGAGQELRLEAVPGTQLQRYSATFREPFLFDTPNSLTVGGYYFTRRFDEYDETRLGSRITLGRRLGQYWGVSAGIRVENVEVLNVPFFAPIDYQSVRGDNFLFALRGGVTRDTRDSYLRPTEGSLVEASYEQVLGDFTFPVFNLEANKYFTTYQRPDGSGRHVLAVRSQVGITGANAPVFERFFAGGFRSLRGFDFRGVGPFVNGFNVGGDFLFLNSLEYQVPVRANDQIYLVGFVDSGTVEPRVDISNYRVAAGVGVRFIVPMLGPVPIALDFGFPVVKGPHDRERIFSFWLGFFH
ncbi:MAG TPA: outer membrane protein assembly factor BamA [Gemmataceae bacterium]|nr:outer membrane protein assembly factor BamA [Gemmataceae bacterium]